MKKWRMLFLIIFTWSASEAQVSLRTRHYNLEKSVAIQGYDPVAYFTQNKAVKGTSSFQYTYEGVIYRFASQANLDLFKQAPQKYEPQYGGWCAYAMGVSGEKVEIDPETFKIKEGKLYLFYHSWTNNTLPKWNETESKLLPNADRNWKNTFR